MLITRKSRGGGKILTTYPLRLEPRTGLMAIKMGYCEGCNEPIFFRTIDVQNILDDLYFGNKEFAKLMKRAQRHSYIWNFIHNRILPDTTEKIAL